MTTITKSKTKEAQRAHEDAVWKFIQTLARHDPGPSVFNPWRDHDPEDSSKDAPRHRRNRLAHHLSLRRPSAVLIGEAPGYAGCHFSGIPFTSERNIAEGRVPRVEQEERITKLRPVTWSEASSTIVWNALHEEGLAEHIVMWNAFPFHPFKEDDMRSNRTPLPVELRKSIPFLEAFMKLFPSTHVVTIGTKARDMFTAMEQPPSASLRHPANGGAKDFRFGVRWLKGYLGPPREQ